MPPRFYFDARDQRVQVLFGERGPRRLSQRVATSSPDEANPRRFGAVPSAVIFDLFGTLVPSASMEQRDAISHELADILGVDRQAFAEIVRSTFDERMRGEIGDLRQTYFTLSARLGGSPRLDRSAPTSGDSCVCVTHASLAAL